MADEQSTSPQNAGFPDSDVPAEDAAAVPADAGMEAESPADPTPSVDTMTQQSLDELQEALRAAEAGDGAPVPGRAANEGSGFAEDQVTIDELLKQASFDDPMEPGGSVPDAEAMDLPNFSQVMADAQVSSIDLLRDVDLNVKIELGRSRMLVEDVLKLGEGSVVELDKLAGDPVDVFVNDRLVARGEVLVLNDNFCVRINEIVAGVKDEGQ